MLSGGFQLVSHSWLLMSSMVGPVEVAFRSGPQRIILLTEVVTVSTYVRPVASSITTWLELMLGIPGSSLALSTGCPWALPDLPPRVLASSSKLLPQQSLMVGSEASLALMPLLVGRVQVEKVLLVDGLETSQVLSMKAGGIFLLVLRSRLARGSPQQ